MAHQIRPIVIVPRALSVQRTPRHAAARWAERPVGCEWRYPLVGRLSPALPGSALLLTLAFGCGLASSWIDRSSHSTSTHAEGSMDATTKKQAGRMARLVSAFLATVAEMAVGLATSG
jgi:hypothetical protein